MTLEFGTLCNEILQQDGWPMVLFIYKRMTIFVLIFASFVASAQAPQNKGQHTIECAVSGPAVTSLGFDKIELYRFEGVQYPTFSYSFLPFSDNEYELTIWKPGIKGAVDTLLINIRKNLEQQLPNTELKLKCQPFFIPGPPESI